MERSIEYRIRKESKITRNLFAAKNCVTEIKTIFKVGKIIDLPEQNLVNFQNFDKALETDFELVKQLVNINSQLL